MHTSSWCAYGDIGSTPVLGVLNTPQFLQCIAALLGQHASLGQDWPYYTVHDFER